MRLIPRLAMVICKDRDQFKKIYRETRDLQPGGPDPSTQLHFVRRRFRPALAWTLLSMTRREPGTIIIGVLASVGLIVTELYHAALYLLECVTK